MTPPSRRRALIVGGLGLALGTSVLRAAQAAVVVEGYTFAAKIKLGGSELVLNGTGVRAVAWLKGYAAGLYLAQKATDPQAVQALPGPKRLRMAMLQDVPAPEFSKAFVKGVTRNTEAAELERLQARIQQFAQWIEDGGQVRKSDVIDLDYVPAEGTLLTVNGQRRGKVLPGEDFYSALLRSFVGQRPFDAKLKAGLLGLA
jgi:hypothetical protein